MTTIFHLIGRAVTPVSWAVFGEAFHQSSPWTLHRAHRILEDPTILNLAVVKHPGRSSRAGFRILFPRKAHLKLVLRGRNLPMR